MAGWLVCLGTVQGATQPFVIPWGDNTYSQTNVPPGLSNVLAIAAGQLSSLALKSDGTLVTWGNDPFVPTAVPPGLSNVAAIAAGNSHYLALKSNGTVVAWGDNAYHQTNVPPNLANVVAIAGGTFHSLALRSNGTVVAWGDNTYNQTNVPPGLSNVVAIAGGFNSLALRSDGSVVAWGLNLTGQTNVVPTLTNVVAIAAGFGHSLALRSNGTVVAWGNNTYNQTNVPQGLSNLVAITAGAYHSLALTSSNGTVVAWGRNDYGQINVPLVMNGVVAITAGTRHSLALGYLNDNFAGRIPLTGSNITFRCSNIGATLEDCDPPNFSFFNKSIWYTWTAPFFGGAVIEVLTDRGPFSWNNFSTPILGVYSDDNAFCYLTNDVTARCSSSFYRARVAFMAIYGGVYNILLDGENAFTSDGASDGTGTATISVRLAPPPSNDFFGNRIPIAGDYYTASGSFIGASREYQEPSHGDANLQQTLWWTWTAPTNNRVGSSQVRLTADAVSFPPAMAVYVGNAVGNLTPIPVYHLLYGNPPTPVIGAETNGMTSIGLFDATPGVTYQIALVGRQMDPSGNDISPRYGNFRFSLNNRVLAMTILDLFPANASSNGPIPFSGDIQVANHGQAASNPLRISISALAGTSVRGPDGGFVPTDQLLEGIWPGDPSGCATAPAGLVSWWRSEGNANDNTGAHNGTLVNGTSFAFGQVGQAFSFDGLDDFVSIGATPIPPPWTAELWVNRQDSPDDSAILLGDAATALKLEQWAGVPGCARRVGLTQFGLADYCFNYTVTTGIWTHLAFVASPTNTQLYVNGALQDTLSTNVAMPLREIGDSMSRGYLNRLRALVDELTVYSRALTPSEIVAIYCAGNAGKCLAPPAPSPFSLAPGSSATVHLCGFAPAPTTITNTTNPDIVTGVGYGVYANLQEETAPDTWHTVDQTLLLFGNWPVVGENNGPGGGVIRLDPGYAGLSAFNPLTNVAIVGPMTVPEGTSAHYLGEAFYADGTVYTFSNTAWSAAPSRFTITTNGLFTAGSVTSNTVVSLTAPYSYAGYPKDATTNVLVLNMLPMFTSPGVQANGTFGLTLNGFPGKTNVIEAATNLAPAPTFWVTLATNTAPIWNFTDAFRSNFNRRFYRARELP